MNLGLHDVDRMKQQEKGHFKWREASLSKGMGGEDRSCFKEFLSSEGCQKGILRLPSLDLGSGLCESP